MRISLLLLALVAVMAALTGCRSGPGTARSQTELLLREEFTAECVRLRRPAEAAESEVILELLNAENSESEEAVIQMMAAPGFYSILSERQLVISAQAWDRIFEIVEEKNQMQIHDKWICREWRLGGRITNFPDSEYW